MFAPGLGPDLNPVEANFDGDDEERNDDELAIPAEILLRGDAMAVPIVEIAAHAEQHDISAELSIVVWLSGQHRSKLFRTPAELSALIDGLPHCLQLDDWCHPDVYLDGKVSHSRTFQQLAEVLATGDIGKFQPDEPPNNRDWKKWISDK